MMMMISIRAMSQKNMHGYSSIIKDGIFNLSFCEIFYSGTGLIGDRLID